MSNKDLGMKALAFASHAKSMIDLGSMAKDGLSGKNDKIPFITAIGLAVEELQSGSNYEGDKAAKAVANALDAIAELEEYVRDEVLESIQQEGGAKGLAALARMESKESIQQVAKMTPLSLKNRLNKPSDPSPLSQTIEEAYNAPMIPKFFIYIFIFSFILAGTSSYVGSFIDWVLKSQIATTSSLVVIAVGIVLYIYKRRNKT